MKKRKVKPFLTHLRPLLPILLFFVTLALGALINTGEENEFIDVRAFARVASGVDTRAALAFEQWQVRKRNESAQLVASAYLEKRTVFAVRAQCILQLYTID